MKNIPLPKNVFERDLKNINKLHTVTNCNNRKSILASRFHLTGAITRRGQCLSFFYFFLKQTNKQFKQIFKKKIKEKK